MPLLRSGPLRVGQRGNRVCACGRDCCELGWYYYDGGPEKDHCGMPYEDVLKIQEQIARYEKAAPLVAEGVYPLIDGEYTGFNPVRQIGYLVEEGPTKSKDYVDEIPF